MKAIICQFLVLLVVVYNYNVEATLSAENAAMVKKSTEECIKEGGLSAEDTARITADEIFSPKYKDASEKLQCYLLCYYKKIGIITAEGKNNPEMFMTYLGYMFPDKKDKLKGAMEKCADAKSASPCETVYNLEKCIGTTVMA